MMQPAESLLRRASVGWRGISWRALRPTRDRSLAEIKTEAQEVRRGCAALPRSGFSTTIRKINSRTSFGVGFLPTRALTLEVSFQYKRKPARCHELRFQA